MKIEIDMLKKKLIILKMKIKKNEKENLEKKMKIN